MAAECEQHRQAKEYFCRNPELLLPHLAPYLGDCRITAAYPEYGLFNGKPEPLGIVDIMVVAATTERKGIHVPVEIKATRGHEDRAVKTAKKQLRGYYDLSRYGKVDFPPPQDMPVGLAIVGTFKDGGRPPRYSFSPVEFRS